MSSSSRLSSTNIIDIPDIAPTPECVPVQPTGIAFPVTLFSGKARSFNPAWFNQYSWLEYSSSKDAAFCFPCRFFGSSQSSIATSRPEQVFIKKGFQDWKHATGTKGILACHSKCTAHKEAVVGWEHYKSTFQRGSVAEQLGSTRAEQIKKNRHYITTIAEVLLLCCLQEISMRGHREDEGSENKGNFREILALVAKHDPNVQQRLLHGPRNAVYTSPKIQNTILTIMANLVRKKICNSIE